MTGTNLPQTRPIDRLLALMAQLRNPVGGCPWDVEQNFRSIAPYTIEEAYEVAEAIEQDDMAALKDELGDLLFQVVFHGRMAEEAGHFGFEDIADAITTKMIRRHPHIFDVPDGRDAAAQTRAWEVMKAEERARKSVTREASALDGVTSGLPALTRAVKIQARAARVGFDWTEAAQVLAKIEEEIAEVTAEIDSSAPKAQIEEEIGDLLFAVASLARKLDIDAEGALRRGTLKFERRFRAMETILAARNLPIAEQSLDQLDQVWDEVKAGEGKPMQPLNR
jgi:MazG family protein